MTSASDWTYEMYMYVEVRVITQRSSLATSLLAYYALALWKPSVSGRGVVICEVWPAIMHGAATHPWGVVATSH